MMYLAASMYFVSAGKAPRPLRALFSAAFAGRHIALLQKRPAPLCSMVLAKTRRVLGGKLKLGISGGGPLNTNVQQFVRVAFQVGVVQGYGLTETSACGTVQDPARIEVSKGPDLCLLQVVLDVIMFMILTLLILYYKIRATWLELLFLQ